MGASLRIGTIKGIDIKVHATFLLILALGAFQWKSFGVQGALFGVAFMALVFACVVLHELGHSLVAKAFGVPVRDITLYPIGGVAQMTKRPDTPAQELFIALAGPMVNVGIASILLPLAAWVWGPDAMWAAVSDAGARAPTALTMVMLLISSNVLLAVFNLIPAFPMDGGRVLRALLSMVLPEVKATRVAVTVGRVLAVGMIIVGLKLPGFFMLPVVALFIFMSGGFELRETRLMRALSAIRAGDAVNPYVPRFGPATTVGEAMQALVFVPHAAFAVQHFGRLVGVVTRQALMLAANEEGPWAYVAGVMQRKVPTMRPNDTLQLARVKMGESGLPYVAVVEGELFLGLVTEHELFQHLSMYESLQRPEARVVRPGTEGRL